MFKLGKFLIGVAAAGITAATVYNYLEESKKSDVDEFEDDAPENGEEENDAAERFMTAATRTYTTIKAGSADAMAKVREAIGPKGEEVLDVVGETAGKVKEAVVDSATKVKDILQEEDDGIDDEVLDEAVANALSEEEDLPGEAVHEDDVNKEAVYEGEENGEAIHEDDRDKEAVYEEDAAPEEAQDKEAAEEA